MNSLNQFGLTVQSYLSKANSGMAPPKVIRAIWWVVICVVAAGCGGGGGGAGASSTTPGTTPVPTPTPVPGAMTISIPKEIIIASMGQQTPNVSPSLSGATSATFSITPSLPTGLSLNTGTGQISGTPTISVRRQTYQITATDGGRTASTSLQLHIHPRQSVAVGNGSACAVIGGNLKCWGLNTYGQLGDNTVTSRSTPTAGSGSVPIVTSIAMGTNSTCVVASSVAKCWGYNGSGVIGDGTTQNRLSATLVSGMVDPIAKIAVGAEHACALTVYGEVLCWGRNSSGQLGNGTGTDSLVPVSPIDQSSNRLTRIIDISIGSDTSCAVNFAGNLKCWGFNQYGQLGIGGTTSSTYARSVSVSADPVVLTSVGYNHSCAATENNVYCWGSNQQGLLGNGLVNTTAYDSPQVVSVLTGVQSISAGMTQTCSVDNAGTPKCWGGNFWGSVGDGSTTDRQSPVSVNSPPGIVSGIGSGTHSSCAMTSSGSLYCWGIRQDGRLGDGSTMGSSSIPTLIP